VVSDESSQQSPRGLKSFHAEPGAFACAGRVCIEPSSWFRNEASARRDTLRLMRPALTRRG